jgi:membrane protein DedA with SNARE-associated domain
VTNPDTFAPGPQEPRYRPRPERSIASLLNDLANEIRALFRLEAALFRAELGEKLQRLGRGVAALAVGVILAFSGWIALLAAAVLALATVVRPWLAALIVGLAAIAVSALLLYLGKRWLDARALVPQRTLNSLREDEAWIKERLP